MGRTPTSRLRAAAHPVRLRILSLLTGAELSAAEVARELDLTHANASYHLRQLAAAGLLVVAGEEKVRGGVAKRYRHPWREEDLSPDGPPSVGEEAMFLRAAAEELVRRGGLAVREEARATPPGETPRPRGYSADAEVWLDAEVWARVVQLLKDAGDLVHDHARPPRTPGTLHVNLSAFAFEMRPGPDGDPR